MRYAVAALGLAAVLLVSAPQPGARVDRERFEASVSRLPGHLRERMSGVTWHRGCPVPMRRLRLLHLSHWDFSGETERGRLVIHHRYKHEIVDVFRRLYHKGFPIRRMKLIDRYGGDDRRSLAADNTSAFNCRFVAGRPGVWSQHAYGRAIDVNPVENPYVSGSHVSPPAGAPFADRSRDAKGMVHAGDVVVRAFKHAGWEWGGYWASPRDYQHFSSNGR